MSKEKEKSKHNILEKISFAFGIIVLVALVSYLLFQFTERNGNPPQLVITTAYQPKMKNYTFKVEVENKGDQTAEQANIQLDLYQNGEIAESGSINMNYVPVKSKETSWIVFYVEPKPNDSLVISSVTFVQP